MRKLTRKQITRVGKMLGMTMYQGKGKYSNWLYVRTYGTRDYDKIAKLL